jgi:hypothetical protein
MLIDIPESSDFYTSAENLINGAWNSLTKLLENHEVFEDLGSEQKAIAQYWVYAKPELTSALAMVQHAVEFFLKAKILSISPYLLISLDPRSLPRKSESIDISFSEFRTLDAQDLLKIYNTFSSDRMPDKFNQWFNDMRAMRNKIMHTVDKTLSVEPASLARSILECHEYLVGKNCWIQSRISYLNRSPEHGVGIGVDQDNENDSFIHLAIHRELSLITNRLSPSETKRFFKYDKRLPGTSCPACYKAFSKNEFFDIKWTDHYINTLQSKNDSNGEAECFVCGHVAGISEAPCKNCDGFIIDKSTRECSICTICLG